jgi:NADH-quinone oxidoreductase subunit N
VAAVLSFALALVVTGGGTCALVSRMRPESVSSRERAGSFVGAVTFSIFLASLGGVPISLGFWAKLDLLSAGVAAGRWWLVGVACGSGVLVGYTYLRALLRLHRRGGAGFVGARGARLAFVIAAVAVLFLGIWPRPWMHLVEAATRRLF